MTRITQLFRRLLSNTQGSAMPIIAFGAVTLVTATGAAIDMSRAQMVQARLGNALDAAGLAAGAAANSANLTTEVNKYFYANYPTNYMGSTITALNVTADADNMVLTLDATATLPTTFMQLVGKDVMTLQADAEVTRANRGMEIIMVLDTTGSMAGSKIESLRAASKDLVSVLYGTKTTADNLWIGVVPYTTGVNIGSQSQATSWLRDNDLSVYPVNYPAGATKWKGCVEARDDGLDQNTTIPVAGAGASARASRFPRWFYPDTVSSQDNNWIHDTNGSINLYEAPEYSNSGGLGPNIGCGEPVLAMTSDKATLDTYLQNLNFWRRGGTAANTGLIWSWRMLAPEWRGKWDHVLVDGAVKLPMDYNQPLMDKVVVLMTDGINQFFDSVSADPYYSDYTAYGRLNTVADGGRPDINTNNQNTALARINTKLENVCTAMKAEGIIIYTITFQLGGSGNENTARDLFRDCASKPEYYFDAESTVSGSGSVNLQTAFKQIGDSLANLRLSK